VSALVPASATPHDVPALGDVLLEVRDLVVAYPGRPPIEAVRDVSFTLRAGEAIALVGESGSGKSTLAAALIGLIPSRGRVVRGTLSLEGRALHDLDERGWRAVRGRRIGMVFQEAATALNPMMTVGGHLRETLRVTRRVRGTAAARKALELVQEVGLSDPERRLRQYPHELSGGMRQRVQIAMALAGEPAILVADEPTTALDVTVQAQILALLRQRQRERGMSLVLISHALPVVASVVDRVVILYGGRVMETGAARTIFAAPRHPYTAALLEANPDVDRDLAIRPIPGAPPRAGEVPRGCPFAPRCGYVVAGCREATPPVVAVDDRELACLVDPLRPR
jgi:oligopeptide/dipeptide ABC transporter ATP-binding protein